MERKCLSARPSPRLILICGLMGEITIGSFRVTIRRKFSPVEATAQVLSWEVEVRMEKDKIACPKPSMVWIMAGGVTLAL